MKLMPACDTRIAGRGPHYQLKTNNMAHTYAGTEERSRDHSRGASKYIVPALIAAAILGLGAWAMSNDDVQTDTTGTQGTSGPMLNGTQ